MLFNFSSRDVLQLLLLVSIVPVQYYLASRQGFQLDTQSLSAVADYSRSWLSAEGWKTYFQRKFAQKEGVRRGTSVDDGESPATEVLEFRSRKFGDYFGTSSEPRKVRPWDLELRVGQVVRHKKWQYRGVVVGWDLLAKAPKIWMQEKMRSNPGWKDGPHFVVLVDTRDRPSPQLVYVSQEEVQVVTNAKVLHPLIDNYFEHFDGAQYLPRPWLKATYPLD